MKLYLFKIRILHFLIFLLLSVLHHQIINAKDSLKVEFSHNRNFYTESFRLTLSSNDNSAVIIYTTDCSKPSPGKGIIYQEGFEIDSTQVIKAIAFTAADTSEVVTNTFLFPETIAKQPKLPVGFPSFWGGSSTISADYEMDQQIVNNPMYSSQINDALKSVPTVSLTMNTDDWFNPETGLYVGYPNSDVSREKAVTAEFIFDNADENFAVECGVQNQGGTSIVNWKVPKQSMRLLFKEIYGPAKLKHKLFPDSEIKSVNTLVLDGFLYSWVHSFDETQRKTSLFFRDQLASDMQNKMGWNSFHGIYVNLFINGLYWGMYDLHERPDEDFMEEYLDAPKEEFDIIKHNPNTVVHGSNVSYFEMLETARKGLSTAEGLKNIQKFLDLPAFIDYMILNFYLGNYDWAHQNFYAARNYVRKTGFRFYTWDAEHVMRYSDVNFNNVNKNDKGGPTEMHSFLKQNAEYRMMFADAVYRHFFNNGVLTPESFEESFLYRKNEIESVVILESARWGDYRKDISAGVTYTKNDHWIPEVDKVLTEYIPNRRNIVLSQLRGTSPRLFPEYMPPVFTVENQLDSRKKVELKNPNTTEGDIYYTLDGTDPRAAGGIIHGTKYTNTLEIGESTIVKARFFSKSLNIWSALAEQKFVFNEVAGKEIVINEIMYNPLTDFPEFIEIYNTGESAIELNGFVFSKGIDFTFQTGSTVLPAEGIVLTNDTALFRDVYGFAAYGQYYRQLSNGGETLVLKNRYNQTVDSVTYSDTIPWPSEPDGQGFSLELKGFELDNSDYTSWKSSEIKNGTPFEPKNTEGFDATLFPNPFSNKLYIKLKIDDSAFGKFKIEVYNQYGSLVYSPEIYSYNSKLELNLGHLLPGLYIIRVFPTGNNSLETGSLKAIKLN